MRKVFPLLLIVPLMFSGCKKCVECEIRLKESQDIIGHVDEFCGTDKKVGEEEDRLRADYTCIRCQMMSGFGMANSGVLCGDRTYTDSIYASWQEGAAINGTSANCVYYRDTANVTCVLKQ